MRHLIIACVALLMLTSCASRTEYAYGEYDGEAIHNFINDYMGIDLLSRHLKPNELADILKGKGKQGYSDWLGDHFLYSGADIEVLYTKARPLENQPLHVWNVDILKARLPSAIKTKQDVVAFFKILKTVDTDSIILGSDCGEAEFTFEGNLLNKININTFSCH